MSVETWRGRARLVAGYGGLGVLAAAGQAPLGWWWLSIAALAGLLAMLPANGTARTWGARMWLAGIGYFAVALFWIIEPFFIEPEIHGWMAPFALVLMAGGMALFWAGAGALARGSRLGLVAAFVLLELLRGWVFTGFPWAMLGHGLVDTPMMQLASVIGAAGLSLLVLTAALMPALGRTWRARGLGTGASVMLLALAWAMGPRDLPPDRAQIVRLAQPNAPQSEKWRNELEFFYRLLDQTSAAADTAPDLILWPETAVPFLLEYAGDGLDMMQDASAAHSPAPRIGFGVQRHENGRYFNSLAILDGTEITHIYDKHHLVPFGEYIPFAQWLMGTPIGGLAGQALLGYSAGPGPEVLDLGVLGMALPLICYESIFPRHLRSQTRPDWILQITNDAWFGEISGPYQHLAQARLRAVEQGLPVLRAANTGVSAVIDARGGIVAQLDLGVTGYLDAAIPGSLPPTVYARLGDWPLIGALLAFFSAVQLRRRAQKIPR